MNFSIIDKLIIFGLIIIIGAVAFKESQFHLDLSPEERKEIFGTFDLNVPEYELIQISHSIKIRRARGADYEGRKKIAGFNAFGRPFTLALDKVVDVLSRDTPIWFAQGEPRPNFHVNYTRIDTDTLHDALKFYEDPNNMAGILVLKHPKSDTLEFMIHLRDASPSSPLDRLEIKRIPTSLFEKWSEFFHKHENSRPVRNTNETTLSSENYYIAIIKEKKTLNSSSSSSPTLPPRISSEKTLLMAPSYSGPNTIYVKILLFINYNIQFISDRDTRLYKLLVYLISFWNAVNLNFNNFLNPAIRLCISGIIIGNNRWAAPYLQRTIEPGKVSALAQEALLRFRWFITESNDEKIFNSSLWDIAITQTDIGLCVRGHCNYTAVAGFSYFNQTCNNEAKIKNGAVAIIHDDSYSFNGIYLASHEIGHILGAHDDGLNETSCMENGYIMEASNINNFYKKNADKWSPCSINEILTTMRKNYEKCWKNNVNETSTSGLGATILPGHMVNLEDQCRARGFTDACHQSKTTCEVLYCWNKKKNVLLDLMEECKNAGVPLSGTYCRPNAHCKKQICVDMDI